MTKWWSGVAAAAVTVATIALVVLGLTDADVRAWGVDHALTSATVTGLLVLLITVLVVDQVVDARQARSRSRAVAAQGTIVLAQALRSIRSVTATLDGSGTVADAEDDVRTFTLMLLVSAPVLIELRAARAFLEEAQRVDAEVTRAVARTTGTDGPAVSRERLEDAEHRIRAAAAPLVGVLRPVPDAGVAST